MPYVQSSHHDFEADTRAQKLADGATDESKSKLQELHRQRGVGVSDVRSAMDPWLDHTGWASHLSGFEKEKLRASLNAAPQREADEEHVAHHQERLDDDLDVLARGHVEQRRLSAP